MKRNSLENPCCVRKLGARYFRDLKGQGRWTRSVEKITAGSTYFPTFGTWNKAGRVSLRR
jgi:hypothetical protein